jgi:predicted RND superfamily exporter protein
VRGPTIVHLLAAVRRRRAFVVAAILALTLVSVAGIRRLSFDTDVLSLLPQSGRVTPAFREFLAYFGSLDQLYVVFSAPEDHGVDEYRDEIEEWIAALKRAPEIVRVDAGVADDSRDFNWLADRQLLLFRGLALDNALGRLRPDGVERAVAESRELLAVPSAEVAALVREDPVGLLTLLRGTLGNSTALPTLATGRDGYVTADSSRRLILARPARPPYDADFSRALDARLHLIEQEMARRRAAGDTNAEDERLPPLHVDFTGGHRIAVETEAIVRRESILNSVGSLVLILPLLFIVFRSLWLVLVGPLPAGLSLVIVLGVLGFLGTRLSAAGTGAAAILFGLGIDGVVLLYVAHLWPRAGGIDDGEALAGPSTSMLLGMWTTAATFYGLAFVDFPSLQQLGLLVGHTMVICGVVTLLLVPALLPRERMERPRRTLSMRWLATWIPARRTPVLVIAALVTVALGAASVQLRIDPTLDRLRSVTEGARLETEAAEAFGLPKDIYVILAGGEALEPLLEANEQIVERLELQVPGLAVEPPTRLLPSAAAQAARAARVASAGFSPNAVRASLEEARTAQGFVEGSFARFESRVDRLLDTGQRLTYDGYVDHGLGDLLQRFIARDGSRWLLATYAFPANEQQASALHAIIGDVDEDQTLTGLPLVNQELARGFVPEFFKGLGIGVVLVIVIIVAAFRDLRLSMLALLPTLLGLIWTSGLLALAGIELDLFAVFGVVTLFGIGVDYGVHLVHRSRERGDAAQATAELAPVILVAAAITILGYGTLVTSSYPPLRSIGVVSVVSVIALAAASVLVLPALLTRRHA